MKKFASIYLNVLLISASVVLYVTIAYTLVVGHSPYESLGIDPGIGTMFTLGGIALLFCVPHLLNRDFTSRASSGPLRIRKRKGSTKPTLQ